LDGVFGGSEVKQARGISRSVVDIDLDVVAPGPLGGSGDKESVDRRRSAQGDSRGQRPRRCPANVGLRPTVLEEIAHAVADWAVDRQAAKGTLEIVEAEDVDRIIDIAARGIAHEGSDGRADSGDGVDAAGDLFDVYAWISRCDRHLSILQRYRLFYSAG